MINDDKLETSILKNNCTADVAYINFVVNDLFVQTISETAWICITQTIFTYITLKYQYFDTRHQLLELCCTLFKYSRLDVNNTFLCTHEWDIEGFIFSVWFPQSSPSNEYSLETTRPAPFQLIIDQ